MFACFMSARDPLLHRVTRNCPPLSSRNRSLAISLALGQAISLLIAGTGISSSYLVEWGAEIPATQSALNYVLLCCVYTALSASRRHLALCELRLAWWKYAVLAVLDVEANFLIVTAYQYTSITSVMLIDCWTIPCVMLLSWWKLGARFKWQHIFGVALCLAGLAILVASDFVGAGGAHQRLLSDEGLAESDVGGIPRAVLGDLLCFLGATLYAVSNVAQEVVVKSLDRIEYLAQLGFWGALVSSVQVSVLLPGGPASSLRCSARDCQ
jgi:solute carrier family 35, member F1/2